MATHCRGNDDGFDNGSPMDVTAVMLRRHGSVVISVVRQDQILSTLQRNYDRFTMNQRRINDGLYFYSFLKCSRSDVILLLIDTKEK